MRTQSSRKDLRVDNKRAASMSLYDGLEVETAPLPDITPKEDSAAIVSETSEKI